MNKKKLTAITAIMDGKRAIAETIGPTLEISACEALGLCNFAKLGLLASLSRIDGEPRTKAIEGFNALLSAIQREFATPQHDGLTVLANLIAAILDGEKLGKFIVPTEDA